MLDTDTCSYVMKRSHPLVLKRLQAVPIIDVCMSVVTKAELLCGVEVSPRRNQDAAALAAFLPYVEALAYIAAHARALGMTLVTNNTQEFQRVSGLATENWTTPPRRKR